MAAWLIGRGLASEQDLERVRQEEEERIQEAFNQVVDDQKGKLG